MSGSSELPPLGRELAKRVDEELNGFLLEQRGLVAGKDPGVAAAFDELDRLVEAGGKRLRPVFACLGHLAAGREVGREMLLAAAALELLHTFALVHDDVMDRSRTRRGVATSWVRFAELHRQHALRGDPDAYGTSGAVLVGDLAIALADQAFLESGFAPDLLLPGLERYNRMRTDMVAGQFLDVTASHRGEVTEPEARRIAVLKSGVYTVEGPLHIGAALAHAGRGLLTALSRYGVALGEAFQLRDDVLGAFGDPAVTGKDRDADLLEGKRTLLVARALAVAASDDRDFLESRLGKRDLSPQDLDRMRWILERSGALGQVRGLIGELAGRARGALDPRIIQGDVASTLAEMVDFLAGLPA